LHKPVSLTTFRQEDNLSNIYIKTIGLTPALGGQFVAAGNG